MAAGTTAAAESPKRGRSRRLRAFRGFRHHANTDVLTPMVSTKAKHEHF